MATKKHRPTELRTIHAFRSTVQNLPLRTRCLQGGHHFEIDVPKVGLIFKLMCPRWTSFSNFKLAGHIQKEKTEIIAAEMNIFLYFSGPIAVGLRENRNNFGSSLLRGRLCNI